MKPCECGCGQPTPIAKANHRSKGHVKGEPVRFVNGHNARGVAKSPETIARMKEAWKGRPRPWLRGPRLSTIKPDAKVVTLHQYLLRHYPKAGVCARCGKVGKTDFAFLRHPAPHTRDRADYEEMCRPCHMRFDYENGGRS